MAITTFHKPTTLQEALQLKAELKAEGVLLAGGTDVLVHIAEGKLHGSVIIDLTGIEALKTIGTQGAGVTIGAGVTFTEAALSPLLKSYCGLQAACRSVGSPQIRNGGTLGGNLANGSPAADSAPPLLALDATVVLQSLGGVRRIPLCDFYAGKGSTVLADDEILTEIEVPAMPVDSAVIFEKLGLRNALAISRLSLALYLETDGEKITLARAASGSLGLNPMREPELEAYLTGLSLDGDWVPEGMRTLSDVVSTRLAGRSTMPYKRVAVQGVFENAAHAAQAALRKEGAPCSI